MRGRPSSASSSSSRRYRPQYLRGGTQLDFESDARAPARTADQGARVGARRPSDSHQHDLRSERHRALLNTVTRRNFPFRVKFQEDDYGGGQYRVIELRRQLYALQMLRERERAAGVSYRTPTVSSPLVVDWSEIL